MLASESEHLALVREGFAAKTKSPWLDRHGECRVLAPLRRGEPLLHSALSLLFNEPPVHFVSRLYRSFEAAQYGGGGAQHATSLKTTWRLDGGQTTEELLYLVTVCRDGELAAVDKLLDLPPFNMSLATLNLSVPDIETRKLLDLIARTANEGLKRHPLPPSIAKIVESGALAPPPPRMVQRQYTGDI